MSTETITKKKKRKPLDADGRKLRRIALIAAAVVLVIVLAMVARYLVRYQFYDGYQAFLTQPAAQEEGREFTPLAEDESSVSGFQLVAESDVLKLYCKPNTGEIAVYDMRNGQTVYSNPPAADSDAIANGTNKGYLKSQFILDYYNASLTPGSWDSYSMSTALDQLSVQSIDNGVRFIYELGEKIEIKYFTPTQLSIERYEELFAAMSDKDQRSFSRMYVLNDEGTAYVQGTMLQGNNARNQSSADKLLKSVGFTEEEYWEIEAEFGGEAAERLGFHVTLEYRLAGDHLEVTVPTGAIEETGGGTITAIRLLQYMGAAGQTETGYMVVPNGSGSLIRFNNGKNNTAVYSQYVYEMDNLDGGYTSIQNTMPARLPIWGFCRENSSVLANIERGAALASINADVSGRNNSYNFAYPIFYIRGTDVLVMPGTTGAGSEVTIIENDMYQENLTVRYTMLAGDKTGYAGLAGAYRDHLLEEGKLSRLADEGDIPLYYDVIGGVKETAHTLGVQYLQIRPMTTFAQADEIAQALKKEGITHQVMNFQGWMNGGYYHDVPDRLRVLRELGGKSGLQDLSESMTRLGGEFYADVALQNVTSISKRYMANTETSRWYADGYVVQLGQVNPLTLTKSSSLGYMETTFYLLSPKFLPYYVGKLTHALDQIDITGVGLRDLGSVLHSDKRRSEIINREHALDVVKGQLNAMDATGKKLLVSAANDYAFSVANHIINVPMSDTKYFIVDEQVPLYQIILHGCVDYAGDASNLSITSGEQSELLRLIEYGAAPHYIFTYEEAANMKYTGLNRYFTTTFATWKDEAVRTYQYLNEALAPVRGATITAHDTIDNDVVRVRYDNGVTFYINYSSKAARADGQTVPALSYLSVGGDAQ